MPAQYGDGLVKKDAKSLFDPFCLLLYYENKTSSNYESTEHFASFSSEVIVHFCMFHCKSLI